MKARERNATLFVIVNVKRYDISWLEKRELIDHLQIVVV